MQGVIFLTKYISLSWFYVLRVYPDVQFLPGGKDGSNRSSPSHISGTGRLQSQWRRMTKKDLGNQDENKIEICIWGGNILFIICIQFTVRIKLYSRLFRSTRQWKRPFCSQRKAQNIFLTIVGWIKKKYLANISSS